MKTQFTYSGDVNAEHGGMFYSVANLQYRYADVYRITPCSDAGGPDNLFWIESLTVNLPDRAELRSAACPAFEYSGVSQETLDRMTPVQRDRFAIECAVSTGHRIDVDVRCTVQIGPAEPARREFGDVKPDVVLRAGSLIRNYCRNVFMKEF